MFDPQSSRGFAKVAALADDEVLAEFRRLELERRQREVDLALLVGEVERRNLFQPDGMRTVESWCRGIGRWTHAEARGAHRLVRMLRAQADVLPVELAATLPVGHVRELARAGTNPRCGAEIADAMPVLLRWADALDHDAFRTLVRRWESQADVDGAHTERHDSHEGRRVSLLEHDGVGVLSGRFSGLQTAVLTEVLERFEQAEFMADWDWVKQTYGDAASPDKMPRTAAQRRADALVAMAIRAESTPADAQTTVPLVHIVIGYEAFVAAGGRVAARAVASESTASEPAADDSVDRGDLDDLADFAHPSRVLDEDDDHADDDSDAAVTGDTHGEAPAPSGDRAERRPLTDPVQWRCESRSGVKVHPDDVFTAAVVGQIRRVVVDSAGVVVDVGRRRRLFTGALRQSLIVTGGRCSCIGCNVRGQLQIDHVKSWKQHGTTASSNADPKCRWHNNLMNQGFTTNRDADGVWHFYRPDRSEIVPI